MRPHSPLLLLFTTSAQTHIFPEIRIDAIRFLDIFLEVMPDIVVAGWTERADTRGQVHGGRVLEGYLGILNAGTTYGESGGNSRFSSLLSR
jgi:pre-rRNA-processing protein IPI1